MSLTDGRGGLRLAEQALAASQATLHNQATHHTGLNLLKVVCLGSDFGLQEADVRLIPSLLLKEKRWGQKVRTDDETEVVLFILAKNF